LRKLGTNKLRVTETDKKEAVAEYEESMASEDEDDESEVAS